jgi:hypothetical protein
MSRAQTITTHRLVPEAILCVPKSQAADYRAIGPDILTHPDQVKGLTPKLNWILDHFKGDDVLLLDDDLTALAKCFISPGERPSHTRDPGQIAAVIRQTARLAGEIGAYLWGFEANHEAIRYYTGLKPFMLTGYINGCATGFRRGHGLRYDERIVAKNDFDICCQNAWRHRLVFKNCRYAWVQKDTFCGAGGQSHWRTSQTERNDVALLQRKYGDVIQVSRPRHNKRALAGAMKITLSLPF